MTHNKINNKPTKQKSNLNNKQKIKIIKINKTAKMILMKKQIKIQRLNSVQVPMEYLIKYNLKLNKNN